MSGGRGQAREGPERAPGHHGRWRTRRASRPRGPRPSPPLSPSQGPWAAAPGQARPQRGEGPCPGGSRALSPPYLPPPSRPWAPAPLPGCSPASDSTAVIRKAGGWNSFPTRQEGRAGRTARGQGPGGWRRASPPASPALGVHRGETHPGQASGLPRRPRGAREEKGWDEGRLAGLSLWLSGGQLPCPAWGGGTPREVLAHHPSSESGRCHVLGARLPADRRGLQASETHRGTCTRARQWGHIPDPSGQLSFPPSLQSVIQREL